MMIRTPAAGTSKAHNTSGGENVQQKNLQHKEKPKKSKSNKNYSGQLEKRVGRITKNMTQLENPSTKTGTKGKKKNT